MIISGYDSTKSQNMIILNYTSSCTYYAYYRHDKESKHLQAFSDCLEILTKRCCYVTSVVLGLLTRPVLTADELHGVQTQNLNPSLPLQIKLIGQNKKNTQGPNTCSSVRFTSVCYQYLFDWANCTAPFKHRDNVCQRHCSNTEEENKTSCTFSHHISPSKPSQPAGPRHFLLPGPQEERFSLPSMPCFTCFQP